MTVREVTSRDNPIFKRIRLVASQRRRSPQGLVLAEGIRCLEEAVAAGRIIEAVLYSADFGSGRREAALLATLGRKRVNLFHTSDRLLRSVSSVITPQNVLALVYVPIVSLSEWPFVPRPLIVCACGVQDPGNLGTLIRTAAAAGADLLCTVPGTVSARNPKTVRASAGAFFRLPVAEHVDLAEILSYCRARSVPPYLADARGSKLYTELDYLRGCAIFLGNEGRGLADPLAVEAESIRIPMAPGVESLNVGIAGALVLFEAFRQRCAF